MIVFSPMIWMTSPSSCSSPTNWTSYIRGRSPVAGTAARSTLNVFRTPASLNPCTNSSRPTAASSISDHQQLADDVRGEAALLPPSDDPQVLNLAVLADDVIEDREDGEGMDVRVAAGLEEMELLDRPDKGPDAEGLEVLDLGREILREGVVAQPGREPVHVQGDHLSELGLRDLEPSVHEGIVPEGRLRGPESQQGPQVHDVDLAADELAHEPRAIRALRDDDEEVVII